MTYLDSNQINRMVSDSICLLLLFDITNKASFNYATEKYSSLKSKLKAGKSFVVLLANKCDLDKKRAVSTQQVNF